MELRQNRVIGTPLTNHKLNIALNLLDREFTTNEPNQKWAANERKGKLL